VSTATLKDIDKTEAEERQAMGGFRPPSAAGFRAGEKITDHP